MPTEMLTDEQAALIWSGQTITNTDPTPEPDKDPTPAATPKDEDDKTKEIFTDNDITEALAKAFSGEPLDDDDTDIVDKPAQDNKKTPGRKTSDLVSMVNQLVKDEVLFGYGNDDGGVDEINTIDEAKELIVANLKEKEEKAIEKLWNEKVQGYSPQVQAILQYAESGGQDISTLLEAIGSAESIDDLNIETKDGQKAIIREALRIRGFDDADIDEQITTLDDLDKLQSKAEKYLPELNNLRQQQVERMIGEQMQAQEMAREASRIYLKTIEDTLRSDDTKLKNVDKAKIFNALSTPKYKSLSGMDTNEFVKTLEELQFGKEQNYKHFLDIVHLTIDRQGFIEKLKNDLKNEVVSEQVKKLKTAKSNTPNSEQDFNQQRGPKNNNTIQRNTFKNPFA